MAIDTSVQQRTHIDFEEVRGALVPKDFDAAREVAAARESVGSIKTAAEFSVSAIGMLRREDEEIAMASEVLRLRAALEEVARLCPKPGGAGQVARDALRIGA